MSVLSRRRFLSGAGGAVAAAAVGPYIVRAQAVTQPQKVRMAFVGTGGRGGSHLGLGDREVCVAYCDVDQGRWPKGKTGPRWPNAKGYTDWRKMFDNHEKEIDAVVVATPDHTHAPASMRAIKAGKHCYTEKPLTWSVDEARALAEATARHKVATQMGNQGHANQGNRLVVEWVRAGAIGDVKEIHTWTNRPVWPQGIASRPASEPVPQGLDWDCWIGAAPFRDYHKGLHSFAWRGWFDFGCGAIGDMGCHTWDNVFWAMDPDYPSSVELLEIIGKTKETFASKTHFKWEFPAKGARPAFTAHWYSGGLKPAAPDAYVNDPFRKDKSGKLAGLPGSGSIYIGAKGVMLVSGDYGDSPRLVPESTMKEYQRPDPSIPRSPGHTAEWLMACRGEKPWDYPGSNFARYAGPLTEVMLLGAICERIGEVGFRIECDPVNRIIKTREALALAGRENRKGWTV
jgi:predicted dehydrogenase